MQNMFGESPAVCYMFAKCGPINLRIYGTHVAHTEHTRTKQKTHKVSSCSQKALISLMFKSLDLWCKAANNRTHGVLP